jgi:hypothetical protein
MSKVSKFSAGLLPFVSKNAPLPRFLLYTRVKKMDKVDVSDANKSEWIKLEFLMDPDNPK